MLAVGFSPNIAFSKKQEHENIRIQSCFIFYLLTNYFWQFSILFNVYHQFNKEKLIKRQSKELTLKIYSRRALLISKTTNEQNRRNRFVLVNLD